MAQLRMRQRTETFIDAFAETTPDLETTSSEASRASRQSTDTALAMPSLLAADAPLATAPADTNSSTVSIILTNGDDLYFLSPIYYPDYTVWVFGLGGNDTITGYIGNDVIFGAQGDDYLSGYAGTDSLYGGDGNDILVTGRSEIGVSELDGGAGNDWLWAGLGGARLNGGAGFDIASYEFASDRVVVNLTDPSLNGGAAARHSYSGIEQFDLSSYNDVFFGADAADLVSGRDGHDDLSGLGGNDWLDGGAGFDQLHGGDGDDTLTGGKDGDGLYGEANNDLLFGNDGNDGLFGDDGNDTLDGGAGADVLRGGNGYDIASYADAAARVSIDFLTSATWTGDAEGDFLDSIEEIHLTGFDDTFRGDPRFDIVVDGGAGNDFIYCVSHNDTLRGGFGNDTLVGGMGGDLLVGGADADIFKYLTVEDSQNILINGVLQQDQILDFTQGQDKIDLSTIDADPGLPGDQAFVFVADPAHYTGNWTGVVAQITWADGTASICASTDADPECEFIIYMSHPYQFTANDFIL